jgi:hypothetical protein
VPYLFLPWQLLPGEHYGRSYVEAYEADLDLVDGLTKTIAQGSAAIARFVTLVSPTGLTNKKQVAQADNGDVITGREDDVTSLESKKSADFATADSTNCKASSSGLPERSSSRAPWCGRPSGSPPMRSTRSAAGAGGGPRRGLLRAGGHLPDTLRPEEAQRR